MERREWLQRYRERLITAHDFRPEDAIWVSEDVKLDLEKNPEETADEHANLDYQFDDDDWFPDEDV